jgi:hypothetical protein
MRESEKTAARRALSADPSSEARRAKEEALAEGGSVSDRGIQTKADAPPPRATCPP